VSGPGECGGDRSKQDPLVVVECYPVDLSAEHTELVAQHHDLEVFATCGTDREMSQRRDE